MRLCWMLAPRPRGCGERDLSAIVEAAFEE